MHHKGEKMKNLANCKPSEFLSQTSKIRKSVEKWLELTDIINIRKRMPIGMPEITADLSKDELEAVNEKRRQMLLKKAKENLSAILDACLDDYPNETLEILALCCFVDPKDVDDYEMKDFLNAALDMIEDETVIRFFTLLMRLAK